MAGRRIVDEGSLVDNYLRSNAHIPPKDAVMLGSAMSTATELHVAYGADLHETSLTTYAEQLAADFEVINEERDSDLLPLRSTLMAAHIRGVDIQGAVYGKRLSTATNYLLHTQVASEVRAAKQVSYLRNICEYNPDAALTLVAQAWPDDKKIAFEDAFQELPISPGKLLLRGFVGESAEQIAFSKTMDEPYSATEVQALQWGTLMELAHVLGMPPTQIKADMKQYFPAKRSALTNGLPGKIADIDQAMTQVALKMSSRKQFVDTTKMIAEMNYNARLTLRLLSRLCIGPTTSAVPLQAMG
jgi:hypothetical protein